VLGDYFQSIVFSKDKLSYKVSVLYFHDSKLIDPTTLPLPLRTFEYTWDAGLSDQLQSTFNCGFLDLLQSFLNRRNFYQQPLPVPHMGVSPNIVSWRNQGEFLLHPANTTIKNPFVSNIRASRNGDMLTGCIFIQSLFRRNTAFAKFERLLREDRERRNMVAIPAQPKKVPTIIVYQNIRNI